MGRTNGGRIVYSGGTKHGMHLALTLITCGLWAPVWIIAALFTSKQTKTFIPNQPVYYPPQLPQQPYPQQWSAPQTMPQAWPQPYGQNYQPYPPVRNFPQPPNQPGWPTN